MPEPRRAAPGYPTLASTEKMTNTSRKWDTRAWGTRATTELHDDPYRGFAPGLQQETTKFPEMRLFEAAQRWFSAKKTRIAQSAASLLT
jgi:hypothetical protein